MPLYPVLHKDEGLTEADVLSFADALASIGMETPYGDIVMPPIANLDAAHLGAFLSDNEQTFFTAMTLPEEKKIKSCMT